MLNLLGAEGTDVINNVIEYLSEGWTIFAIVLASVGGAFAFLAKRITLYIKKTDKLQPNDRLLITLRMAALAIILIALILASIPFLETLF